MILDFVCMSCMYNYFISWNSQACKNHVQSTYMARISLGPWKFVGDACCLSHSGLIMAPGQEANGGNLGKSF